MRTSLLVALLAVAVPIASLPVTRAHAQPAKPVDKKKAAKEYVDAGQAAQTAGDYETAIEMYSKAYELVPHPVLLFNMAQAHRLAGRATEAVDLYRRYLAEEPKGSKAKTAREFITALEQRMRAEETRKAQEAAAAEEARKAEEARRAEEARKAQEAEDARKAQEAADAARKPPGDETELGVGPAPPGREGGGSPGGGLRLGGMVAGGLGVVSLSAGIYFGMQAKSIADELSEPGAPFTEARDEEGKSASSKMVILTAAGGALVVGGAVMFFMGRSKGKQAESAAAIAPMFVNGGGGIAVHGGF
jgi:tetratricopeptide (TPR) repeat protein